MLHTRCPNCNSGATQAAQMIVASGTRSYGGSFASYGSRGGGRYGVSAGTSRSALASWLDPGPIPGYAVVAGVLVAGLIASTFLAEPNAVWLCVARAVWLLVVAPLAFIRRRAVRAQWAVRAAQYLRTWLCRKCGTTFEPPQF